MIVQSSTIIPITKNDVKILSVFFPHDGTRFPACATFHPKTLQKPTALYLLLGHALENARQHKFS